MMTLLGIELPESVLGHLNVGVGDVLWVTTGPDGIKLSRMKPEDIRTIKAGRRVMRKHREVLKKLADS